VLNCWSGRPLAQGLAGGLMLSISFVDLLPEAIESIGFFKVGKASC